MTAIMTCILLAFFDRLYYPRSDQCRILSNVACPFGGYSGSQSDRAEYRGTRKSGFGE